MSKILNRFVQSPRPPANTNVLWIKDTDDEFLLYSFEDDGWKPTSMTQIKLLEIVAQLQEEIKANNNILGSVTYDGLAPTPQGSGKYIFSTGSDTIKCTWITKDNEGNDVTGVGTFVASGSEVIVVKNLTTGEYEYQHLPISKYIVDKFAIRVEKFNTPGYEFYREGQTYEHTLGIRIFEYEDDITDSINIARFVWKRISENKAGDLIWNDMHAHSGASVNINLTDLVGDTSFIVQFWDASKEVLLKTTKF